MLKETADILEGKRKLILIHGNADMDAFASAYAISRCFPPADIYAPGGTDRVTKIVSENIGIPILDEVCDHDHDIIVVADTSSPEQLLPFTDVPSGSVIIDHHRPTGKWNGMHFLCDDSKVSCSELVYDLIKASGKDIDRETGMMLLSGMLTDSGHFQHADHKLMTAFAEIMKSCGINMDEVMQLTKTEQSMSERVAVMKSIGHSRFDRIGDMIVAVSDSKSFEAAACRALMYCGADVAFVASQRDDEFRLSARTSQEMTRRGMHLGDIMSGLGTETDTDGGGHGGAAGMSGTGDAEAMLHMCMKRTMDEFRKIRRSEPS